MERVRVTEGKTSFFAPVQDKNTQFPPGSAPIFYNPRMEANRDATVLFLSAVRPSEYLDAMGATGVRGLRVANETGTHTTINDIDPAAAAEIRANVKDLGLDAEVTCQDANALMSSRRFDCVDLDPFGTPAPFTDSGCRSARRFLCITATDTAPLCGAHLKAGMRRYWARPMNTEYHGEVGLRVLLGFAARQMIKYDRGIKPLFCFAHEHFIRLHLRVVPRVSAAEEARSRIGYILQCPHCFYRAEQAGMFPERRTCPRCGEVLSPVGPLWLGAINDPDLLEEMEARLPTMGLGTAAYLGRLLPLLRAELPTSSFYDYHRVAKRMRTSPPAMDVMLQRVQEAGYAATRTHYVGTGVKTGAPLEVVEAAVRGDVPDKRS
ncbi:tRNA (guanine(10)-N(2))-dimethyltransferase [Methanofollis formosanus]|uniref:tRNA (guanine(26)-N(2))-dimethyltransferase n=1 Tax=Methanofollis formosanus TaxID=299308 RepID=A0A8G1A3A9_9EURY|nr:tRNA (guanine(10)-N(2))-dimethyltransferase [Methanofollis formosanus]QYZ79780.1 tRNA (guanine(10)-N(2))-dimethyltransferase [Methanofollis formosanus]